MLPFLLLALLQLSPAWAGHFSGGQQRRFLTRAAPSERKRARREGRSGEHAGGSDESNGARIVEPLSTPDSSTPIHLSLSAFQDGDRCAKTIDFALRNAANPERLRFGIVQARTDSDASCHKLFERTLLPGLCKGLSQRAAYKSGCEKQVLKQLAFKEIRPEEGEGPAHQRSLQNGLINFDRADQFCMQTDSHMDFVKDWDALSLADWKATNNEFAVLTAYVVDISAKQSGAAERDTIDCCGWTDESEGVPRGNQCFNTPRREKPFPTVNWAAGFSFHRCHAEQNVPVDRNLEWIFTGEEVDRAARLWTSGYDLYNPSRVLVLHNYSHAQQRFWSYAGEEMQEKQRKSREIVSSMLGLSGAEEHHQLGRHYALGKQRTVRQWRAYIKPTYNHPGQSCFDLDLPRVPVADRRALVRSARKPSAQEEV